MQSTSRADEYNVAIIWQVWLSSSVDFAEIITEVKHQAQLSVDYLRTYREANECEQFIRSISTTDRIVFVLDDSLAEQILSKIHDLQQIYAVFIYTTNAKLTDAKFKKFSKVITIFSPRKLLSLFLVPRYSYASKPTDRFES